LSVISVSEKREGRCLELPLLLTLILPACLWGVWLGWQAPEARGSVWAYGPARGAEGQGMESVSTRREKTFPKLIMQVTWLKKFPGDES